MANNTAKEVTMTKTDGTVVYMKTKTGMVYDANGKTLDTVLADMNIELAGKLDSVDITAANWSAMRSGITPEIVKAINAIISLGITFDSDNNTFGIGGKKYNLQSGGIVVNPDDNDPIVTYGTPVIQNYKFSQQSVSSSGTGNGTVTPSLWITQTVTRLSGTTSTITYTSIADAIAGGVSFTFRLASASSSYGLVVGSNTGELKLYANTSTTTDRTVSLEVTAVMNGKTSASYSASIKVLKAATITSTLVKKEISYVSNDNGKYGYKIRTYTRNSSNVLEYTDEAFTITDKNDNYTGIYDTCLDLNASGVPTVYTKDDTDWTPNDGRTKSVVLTGFIDCSGAKTLYVNKGVGGPQAFFFTSNNADMSGYIQNSAAIMPSTVPDGEVTEAVNSWKFSFNMNIKSAAKYLRLNVSKGGDGTTTDEYKATINYE